jgi:hypothetical protein
MYEKSRSDFCRLRFKTEGFSRMYALGSHVKPPGKVFYDSCKYARFSATLVLDLPMCFVYGVTRSDTFRG